MVVVACGGSGKPKAKTTAASCETHENGPSKAECEKVVAHLAEVMPDDVSPNSADDVCDCLGMPRELIACLGSVASKAEADACVEQLVPGAGAGGDGGERASLADCEQAVDHLATLDPEYAAAVAESRAEIVEDCTRSASPADVRCLLDAATKDQAEQCVPR